MQDCDLQKIIPIKKFSNSFHFEGLLIDSPRKEMTEEQLLCCSRGRTNPVSFDNLKFTKMLIYLNFGQIKMNLDLRFGLSEF